MNIGSQIKNYREQLKISQEELADKIFVTRQKISNCENNKNYPDIKSLSLLSFNFNVSVDDLIKGDVEKMKEIIDEKEIKKLNFYSKILTICYAILIFIAVQLFMWIERYAFIPMGIVFIITIFFALKVEKLKKDNDIQTYKEIVAFSEGKKLNMIDKKVEIGKRPYQKILLAVGSAIITMLICFLIGLLMNFFLN